MSKSAIVTAAAISLLAARASSAAAVDYVEPPRLLERALSASAGGSAFIGGDGEVTQTVVPGGVSVTLYQNALAKAVSALPSILGESYEKKDISHVFARGKASVAFCDFGYELGFKRGTLKVSFTPDKSQMSFGFKPGNQLSGKFSIDISGTRGEPYAEADLCGIWSPDASPSLSIDRISGSVTMKVDIQDNQLIVKAASFKGSLGGFHMNLGPISWLLDKIGLQDEFDRWLRDLAADIVSAKVASLLPEALTEALHDKLVFTGLVEGMRYTVVPSSLSTSFSGLTVGVDTGLAAAQTLACTGPQQACVEPTWAPVKGRPQDVDAEADAAAAVGLPTMNQALFAAWRAGKLVVDEQMDAAEVIGALLPGFAVSGVARIKAYTERAPTVSLPEQSSDVNATDPSLAIEQLVVSIDVAKTPTSEALSLTLRTELSARAVVEITPPFIDARANPEGNLVRFRMEDFRMGTTTASYGPGSAIMTEAEKKTLIDDLVMPLYREKIGILALSTSIIDFKLPADGRRAALKIVRKQRVADALALYVRFEASPLGDKLPPTVIIEHVDGIPTPVGALDVTIGKRDAIIGFSGSDDDPRYDDFLTYETLLNSGAWIARKYVRAIKVSDLQEGANLFFVRAKDFAGNFSENAGVTVRVDTLPPLTRITRAPESFSRSADVQIDFDGSDAGSGVADYMLSVDGRDLDFASTRARALAGFGEGVHNITVRARDKVGHVDPTGASATFTVDLTPPRTVLSGNRTGYARPLGARFSLVGTDNFSAAEQLSFSSKLEGPACASTDFSAFSSATTIDLSDCTLLDGAYKISVRAKDAAGNIEPEAVTREFMVDSLAPSVAIMQTPPARSTDLQASFFVMGKDVDDVTRPEQIQYMYRVRGLAEEFSAPVSDPEIAIEGLPSGDYTFEVTALDLAENHSAVQSYDFSIDNGAPSTRVNTQLPQWMTLKRVEIDATGIDDRTSPSGLAYLVTVDNADIRRMNAPIALEDLSEGRHSVHIAAVDDFGNVDPRGVRMDFAIDRTAPETALTHTPTKFTTGAFRPAFGGSDNLTPQDELRYTYRITRGPNSTEWTEPALAADIDISLKELGAVKIEIAAVDNAGLIDQTPTVLNGEVKATSGCACASTQTTDEELLSFAFMVALVLAYRRRHMVNSGERMAKRE